MALAFDSLSLARYLRDHGIPQDQSEALADGVRNFVMVNLATQEDILSVRQDLANFKNQLETSLANAKQELQTAIDNLALRLTVRLGILLAVGIAALGAIVKLSP
jgi:hypothetical protein